ALFVSVNTFRRAVLFFSSLTPRPPRSTLCPYTTLFRSQSLGLAVEVLNEEEERVLLAETSAQDLPELGIDLSGFEKGEDLVGSGSEEHMSELQSRFDLVCRLLLEKKK